MAKQKVSRSVLLHHIETSLYALSAVILAGWVTDALNEDLMFRIVTRHFFPQAVADYQHPLSDMTSLLIWGIPLLVGLLLMLAATVLTVRHLKKRHVYVLSKAKCLSHIENIILCVPVEELATAAAAYADAHHIHLLCQSPEARSDFDAVAARLQQGNAHEASVHALPRTDDLHSIATHLTSLVHRLTDEAEKKDHEIAFDIGYTTPLVAAAALYASLETDLSLARVENGAIMDYTTEPMMEE